MFESAKAEANSEFEREDFYSSTISWDFLYDDTISEGSEVSAPELQATKRLFDLPVESRKIEDSRDKRCLRNFSAARDDYAVDYVLKNFLAKPHMAQRYAKYLKPFVMRNEDICREVERIFLEEDLIYEFQLHWLYALLEYSPEVSNGTVISAIRHLQDPRRSEVIRAVSAVFIGKFGSASQRGLLRAQYQDETPFVRAAILYALKHFPKIEQNTCFRAWGGHDEIYPLVIKAAKKMMAKE
jgi:hypothetical protein